jgi:hypothetical protein
MEPGVSDLYDLLSDIRSHHVDLFEKALGELREQGRTLIIEPPVLTDAGELAREGALNLGARYDLAIQEGESATPSMFQSGRMLDFQPIAFEGGGLSIVIAPFPWDGVRLAIDGDALAISAALAGWFENAIGAPEGVEEDGIQHAAHFLSDPVIEGATSLVQADLGTADVDVLIDLFDRLRLAGATRVELSLPPG